MQILAASALDKLINFFYKIAPRRGNKEDLHDISEWCNYRNEVIHALLNKNIESLNEELAEQAMEGMKLARYLDAQIAALKKGNVTRKKLGLPMK